LNYIEGDRTTT